MARAICDVCGFEYDWHDLMLRWDNLMVCEADYETRNEQDFVRAVPDGKPLPWSRPPPEDVELVVPYLDTQDFCSGSGRLSHVEYGTVGCMTVENFTGGLVS
jgi:hypothetical protein